MIGVQSGDVRVWGAWRVGPVALAFAFGAAALPAAPARASAQDGPTGYDAVSTGTRAFNIGRIAVEVLVEEANLGGQEVEIVEMTFPPGGPRSGGEHRHGRVEIFYVLSGVLEHEVNGVPHRLDPGMVGIVRPEDTVAHRVLSDEPVRTLVIWAPGGELQRFSPGDPGGT